MSIASLTTENSETIWASAEYVETIDSIDFNLGARPDLNIGLVKAANVRIGGAATPLYLNNALYNPAVGSGYSAVAPIAATNNNGLVIDNTLGQLKCEFADATHNGIMSTTSQTLAGVKSFPSGIICGPITNSNIGLRANAAITSGFDDISIGTDAGRDQTTGSYNVYVGRNVGTQNNGNNNVGVGTGVLYNALTGASNVCLGYKSGETFTSNASNNICIGNRGVVADNQTIRIGTAQTANYQAGVFGVNGDGTSRVVIANSNGQLCTTSLINVNPANFSVAMGALAGAGTGIQTTAIGFNCLSSLSMSGQGNSSVGADSMANMTTGLLNTAIGSAAMNKLTTGTSNFAAGNNALYHCVSGGHNVCIGTSAGTGYTGAESYNICIGNNAVGTVGESNVIRLGVVGQQTANYQAGIFGATGNGTGIAALVDNVGRLCTVASVRSKKENIEDLQPMSNILNSLKPRKFNFIGLDSSIKEYGLIYDEVEGLVDDMLIKDQNGEPSSLKYQYLPVMLLKGFKEQQALINQLQTAVSLLESRLLSF